MTSPAMGTITFSDRFCIMLKMFAFHPCGVLPTSAAMVPTFFVYVPEHSGKVAVNGSDKDFFYPFVNRFQYALHRLPSVILSEQTGKEAVQG